MKKHLSVLVLLVAVLSVFGLCDCSALCTKAMPVLIAGQSYAADAQQALDQAQAILDGMTQLPADKRKVVQDGINKVRDGLRAAVAIVTASSESCNAPDLLTAFKAFNDAWSVLKGLFGSNVGAGLIGVAPGSAAGIVDPAIYRKAGGV